MVLLLLGVWLFFLVGCEEKKHPSGRDTIESFGNGRYQIVGVVNKRVLVDLDRNIRPSVEDNVYKYKVRGDLVYVIGQRGYTIVNYRTGEINQYKEINKFTLGDRKIFEDMR